MRRRVIRAVVIIAVCCTVALWAYSRFFERWPLLFGWPATLAVALLVRKIMVDAWPQPPRD
ncbi:MAG TPA: hypothetical protein VNI20_11330 [Fimbriimonadaceae bacterium]|nr:hypothetical protein [Fimbriimonadaceae bacterium]